MTNTNRERGEEKEEPLEVFWDAYGEYLEAAGAFGARSLLKELFAQALKDAREERDGRWRMAITHLSTAQRESVLATLEGYEELLKEREASHDNQPK